MSKIIAEIEKKQLKQNLPEFYPGDTVAVKIKVIEGARTRSQIYEGVVIAIKNRGLNSAFTVRKISYDEGVERTFQTHSPVIEEIVVKRRGDVRKAKLYYLRDRSGKSARIKEKLDTKQDTRSNTKKKAQIEGSSSGVSTEAKKAPKAAKSKLTSATSAKKPKKDESN